MSKTNPKSSKLVSRFTYLTRIQPRLISGVFQGKSGKYEGNAEVLSPWHARCTVLEQMSSSLLKIRPIRRFWHFIERLIPFLQVTFSSKGLLDPEGRILIWGKARRLALSSFPPLARRLQKHYKMVGGCAHCGSSCKLLFQCPHWDESSNLCTVYEDRPNICRLFPITPADIRDRDIVSKKSPCGFDFPKK